MNDMECLRGLQEQKILMVSCGGLVKSKVFRAVVLEPVLRMSSKRQAHFFAHDLLNDLHLFMWRNTEAVGLT